MDNIKVCSKTLVAKTNDFWENFQTVEAAGLICS
jgi:hypothetical protein